MRAALLDGMLQAKGALVTPAEPVSRGTELLTGLGAVACAMAPLLVTCPPDEEA